MRIVCVGGGPAGLYFAILMKRRDTSHRITVFERNPAGSTYGWGVTLSDDLLDVLHRCDPTSARDIDECSFHWSGLDVHVADKPAVRLDSGGVSIGRQRLLDILARRATQLGIDVQFEREVDDPSRFTDTDLIVASDGVNSRLRGSRADQFQTNVVVNRNKYIWLGTSKVFDSFRYVFVDTKAGWIWLYAYGYGRARSTCIVECAPDTWAALGFDRLSSEEGIALLESIFGPHLGGHPLIRQAHHRHGTPWLNFRTVTNRRWHWNNVVLLGDSAHTTHFSIGSGTSLALEDAITLTAHLHDQSDLGSALAAYQRERQRALALAHAKAQNSARWFENVPRYVGLPTHRFAALLMLRRWPMLSHITPLAHCLYWATREFTLVRKLGRWARSTGQDLYIRQSAR
jgi:anthraniloyl-CoA monooxygenase